VDPWTSLVFEPLAIVILLYNGTSGRVPWGSFGARSGIPVETPNAESVLRRLWAGRPNDARSVAPELVIWNTLGSRPLFDAIRIERRRTRRDLWRPRRT
jgi:hypothetical protein